jgi:hypothetical protein
MKEIWKDVVGYEEFYSVSNLGRMWSKRKDKELSSSTNNCGYKQVNVTDGNSKKCMLVHRAVAISFIKNPKNLPVVNHKDENVANNHVDNLEWCTISYNNSYNDIAKRRSKCKKKVYQYDCKLNLINTYESSQEASRRLNISNGILSQCCRENVYERPSRKRNLTLHGFVFSYDELDIKEIEERFIQSKIPSDGFIGKEVGQYTLDDLLIKTYSSTQEVGRQLGISSSNISACCRGKFKQSHGYKWKYVKDIDDK